MKAIKATFLSRVERAGPATLLRLATGDLSRRAGFSNHLSTSGCARPGSNGIRRTSPVPTKARIAH
jgi:hypothetical protein